MCYVLFYLVCNLNNFSFTFFAKSFGGVSTETFVFKPKQALKSSNKLDNSWAEASSRRKVVASSAYNDIFISLLPSFRPLILSLFLISCARGSSVEQTKGRTKGNLVVLLDVVERKVCYVRY